MAERSNVETLERGNLRLAEAIAALSLATDIAGLGISWAGYHICSDIESRAWPAGPCQRKGSED